MDLKKDFFFLFIIATGIIFTGVSWYKYIYTQDYLISVRIPCDPEKESCFVGDCEVEKREDCERFFNAQPDGTIFYKLLEKKAYNFPDCDFSQPASNCPTLTCQPEEKDCKWIFCKKDNLRKGQECSNKK